MAYLDWKVGDKVVCIKTGTWSITKMGETHPQYGEVYTIRWIAPSDETGRLCIRLTEIVNPPCRCGGTVETYYTADRFRKAQTRKTDISQFQAMLHDQRQKVPEA